jgi:DNA repair protein SbcD/Mre11
VKLLHTSDWHVGKTLRGRSRLDEQERVLRELVGLAREHAVDAVLVAGDVYDTFTPSAEAVNLVVRALLGFRDTGAEVIVIAGNHDHARTFDAYRPVYAAGGIHMIGSPRTADDGGVIGFTARSTGEPATVAVLPFLSQRYAARAAELVAQTPAESNAQYDEMIRRILASLSGGFRPDAVNVVLAHLTVTGGVWGGGEREVQSIFDYVVDPAAFPADAHYVALGHLHRRQHIPAPCPAVHYCGSPLNVDFGEEDNPSVALLVEVSPSTPASVTELPVTSAVRLRTVTGTVAELTTAGAAGEFGDDLLRVVVAEKPYAGLREAVVDALPNSLEVRIDSEFQTQRSGPRTAQEAGLDRQPTELFAEFLVHRGLDADPRLGALFAALLDRAQDGGAGESPGVDDDIPLPAFDPADAAPGSDEVTDDETSGDSTAEEAPLIPAQQRPVPADVTDSV